MKTFSVENLKFGKALSMGKRRKRRRERKGKRQRSNFIEMGFWGFGVLGFWGLYGYALRQSTLTLN